MIALIFLALNLLAALVKSKSRLEAENAALRQQLMELQRKVRGRVQFDNGDRLFFVQLYRWFPSILKTLSPRLWLPKIRSGRIRTMRQNQRIIAFDAFDPPLACNVCRRPVQVATAA
jgi:hypothetical protein